MRRLGVLETENSKSRLISSIYFALCEQERFITRDFRGRLLKQNSILNFFGFLSANQIFPNFESKCENR